MRGSEFLDKMELVDAAYLELADAAPREKKKIRVGWRAAMAACICLVLLAGTAAAVSGQGTRMIEMFTGDHSESGYDLYAEAERFPLALFSAEVQGMREHFSRSWENWQPYSSQFPGYWSREFASADDALEFIGFAPLKKPDWEMEEERVKVAVLGSTEGAREITLETLYWEDHIRLQTWTTIYTELYGDEFDTVVSARTAEDISFTESFYTTPGGRQCQIISSSAMESGILGMDGYLVEEGVLYNLHIAYQEPDAARAEELLRQWADVF